MLLVPALVTLMGAANWWTRCDLGAGARPVE
jgi:uncharacterized membrane protein YdfJ with MMPL/SSD domain